MALGVGLLVGAERERRKLAKPDPAAAGIRTFTVASLTGALSLLPVSYTHLTLPTILRV